MPINEPRQTFIPKKSLAVKGGSSKHSNGIFFGIALIIFLLAVASAVGAYGYRVYLEKRVQTLGVNLDRAKEAFEPALIREFQQLSARIDSADRVLSQHVALSGFFSVLGDLTLKSIRFTRFTYTVDETSMNISLAGTARNYSSVALQSDVFGESPYLKNPLFSNLGLDKAGNVTFDFSARVDPSLILYQGTF